MGENVAVLRLSKALQSRSAAFGKFINPTLNGRHATRRALRPPKCFWVSFCYDFPMGVFEAEQGRKINPRIRPPNLNKSDVEWGISH